MLWGIHWRRYLAKIRMHNLLMLVVMSEVLGRRQHANSISNESIRCSRWLSGRGFPWQGGFPTTCFQQAEIFRLVIYILLEYSTEHVYINALLQGVGRSDGN